MTVIGADCPLYDEGQNSIGRNRHFHWIKDCDLDFGKIQSSLPIQFKRSQCPYTMVNK